MKEVRDEIAKLLQSDNVLCGNNGMLPPQANWQKGGTNKQRKWSIMPLDGLTVESAKRRAKPLITIQAGPNNQVGFKLVVDFVYIRCYNSEDKAYITIDDVLSRVKVLLHRHRFNFTGSVSIETLYESTGAEQLDEAYGLKFRESRYRLLRVE